MFFPSGKQSNWLKLYLWACTAWGQILSGLDPQKWTVLSGMDRSSEPHISILWDSHLPDRDFLQSVPKCKGDWACVCRLAANTGKKNCSLQARFLGEANKTLKHQFPHNLRDLYLRVVARGQFWFPLTLRALPNLGVSWKGCLAAKESTQRQSIQHL